MQINTEFSCNAVILISSPRIGEEGTPRRISEDLETLANSKEKFFFRHLSISTQGDLLTTLKKIEHEASKGLRPILHFDMHGNQTKGLELGVSGEMISWETLVEHLRPINIKTNNNLMIFITACYGMNLIKPITIFKPTPFFGLIAPKKSIKVWDIENGAAPFFTELMESGRLDLAYNKLSSLFTNFNSEKMLVISMAKYIREQCKGRGGMERRERLLTESLTSSNIENNRTNRKLIRKQIKQFIMPDQTLLDKYAHTFLMGNSCSVTIRQIEKELKKTN